MKCFVFFVLIPSTNQLFLYLMKCYTMPAGYCTGVPVKFALACLLFFCLVPKAAFCQEEKIRNLKDSLKVAKDEKVKIDILNELANFFNLQNLDSSLYYASRAKDLSAKISYNKGQADAYKNIAIYHSDKANALQAIRYYNDALQFYKKAGDTSEAGQTLMDIAIEFDKAGNKKQAYNFYLDAYQVGKTLPNDTVHALKDCAIVNLLILCNDWPGDSVLHYYNEARASAIRNHDERIATALQVELASYYIRSGRQDSGLALLKASIPVYVDMQFYGKLIDVYGIIGDTYRKSNADSSIRYYQLEFDLANSESFTEFTLTSAEALYELFTAKKDYANAVKYASVFIKSAREYQKVIQESGINYMNYVLKDNELELLKQKGEARSRAIILLCIIVGVIIASAIYIYRLYRSKKTLAQVLEDVNETVSERNQQLEEKNKLSNKLLTTLAHDFRQPLVSIPGFVSLLKEPGYISKEKTEELLNDLEKSTRQSLESFENILQWVKHQISGFAYEPKPCYLYALINESIQANKMLSKQYKVTIVNKVDEQLTVKADKEMIQFVNRNLIHNAIKFSPEESTITIDAAVKEGEVVLSVTDQGKGIEEEKLTAMFDMKKDYKNTGKEKGAGVALVICREFITTMSGKIWVKSNYGKGSAFFYSLPL